MIGSLLALALAQSACTAPEGTAALLDSDRRFIVVGEAHGTAEAPAAFARMVCEAAERGPVTAAVELPWTMYPQLEAFMASDSDASALAALDGTWFLNPTMPDGRTSQAMLEMLQSLRRLKAAGRDIALVAFQPSSASHVAPPPGYYELEMAYLLSRAAIDRPQAKVIVLVGNLHARKTASPYFPGLPAIGHLPSDQVTTLDVAPQGGGAWNCTPECAARRFRSEYDPQARGVFMNTGGDGAYDGILALGPSTASLPVNAETEQ